MAKPMTKTQLVAALADKMDSDKKSAAAGEQIHKEADKVVKMTIAKALKDSVND